jgi:uncharacterized OB-fold protein
MTSILPVPEPVVDPEVLPFWEGTARGELMLRRCLSCGTVGWPPRTFCAACSAPDPEWFAAAGTGEVYSFTVVRRAQGVWRDAVPYVIAYVRLTEGPTVMTNIVDCDPAAVHIGLPVRVVFAPSAYGYALYRFLPDSE